MKKMVCIVFLMIIFSSVSAQEFDITFVGTVESTGEPLTVRVDEVLATGAGDICDTVEVVNAGLEVSPGETVHIHGYYDPVSCVVTIEEENHFAYRIPVGATLEKLGQTVQFTGEIMRIYEMRGETFCDISVEEVVVITYQEKEMCTTVTVKMSPIVGEVEVGLQPGDEVVFSGTYDETSCMGSLGWHDDYLKKERGLGVSWVLILGGFAIYLVSRKTS
ncbi:MAG: hypothetical protein HXS44_13485 [Theionarchaea archaeon]|nr:hypothetical protein [Theionarchaea archaeon]